jgi:outer membrane protein OmpA-like peptidoglycan-associated protein
LRFAHPIVQVFLPKSLTLGTNFIPNESMNPIRLIFFILPIAAWSPALAETMRFEDAAGILGTSCPKDIDASCRGVNLDSARLKDCLVRNEDSMSAQCRADYVRAFDAIQKRVAARAAVRKLCERELVKLCGGVQKDNGSALECVLAVPRGVSARCNQAIGDAGYGAMAPSAQAQVQPNATTESWVNELVGLETPLDMDVAALKQQALERVKSKADAVPLKRTPIATQLLKLPKLIVEVQFDEDTPIVRPDSYRSLGRIADTLYHPSLLRYKFLIVGHAAATGRRDYNLTLSQRRADAVRDILVTTFKISSKRLQAIGLGEEQLLDAAHPTAAVNQRIQVATVSNAL